MDLPFAVRVQGAGGLVEQYDAGVPQQRPGDGNALALPAGEVAAVFIDLAVQAVGQGFQQIVQAHATDDSHDAFEGYIFQAIYQVVPQRAGEQHCILGHHSHMASEAVLVKGVNIDSIDCDFTALLRVKPQYQVHQRGLACS